MTRYVAFLRGVTPMNAKMARVRKAFESASFRNVKTVLASGNVAFDARAASETALARKAEKAMEKHLGRKFYTIVRSVAALEKLLDSDPFGRHRLPRNAKRVVTFLGERRKGKLKLPIKREGARILAANGREVFTAYVPMPRVAVFMELIRKTYGDKVTTRSWDTVRKCAAA